MSDFISPLISGSKGGGKGGVSGGTARAAREAPNTLRSNTIARVVDVISEGEVVGLVDGLRSVYFDGTQVQNSDGSYNFSGVKITERVGLPDQDYIAGFSSVETEVAVGVEILQGTPVVRTITDSDITAVRVKIQIPALTKQDTSTGDLNGFSVSFRIDIRYGGGDWITPTLELSPNPVTISGKTTSPYEAQYRIPLPEGHSSWDIRVVRITADPDVLGVNIQARTYWSTYTAIIDNKIQYVDTAVIGVEVDAQQFGQSVPSRAYDIKGIKIKVPNNYNPDTREYIGIWDGTFKVAWSDNPAWVLYDLMTNTRYGLGDVITQSNADKYSLYEIGKYCDELIPDGYGGYEPRFTINVVINTREEAYKLLFSISSCFRGMLYWSSGLVTATADMPDTPVKLVTPANVIGGEFNYSGSSLKARNSVAVVRYNDPDDEYRSSVVVVENPQAIQKMGWKSTEVTAYGCTSKGQAYRCGRWILDNEKYSTELVNYRASLDHADLRPGSIISVADPYYAGVRYGGRCKNATVASLELDQEVTLVGGESYTISVVIPDGTIEERPVTNPSGFSYANINLGGDPLPDVPIDGAMWVISGTDVEPRLFRVISVSESEKNIFEISALFHDPNKYARVEQDLVLEDIPYTILPTGPIKPPSTISFVEYLYKVGAVLRSATTLSWTASPDPRVSFYEVEMQRPDSDYYESVGVSSMTSMVIQDTPSGSYSFRVRAIDTLGNKSPYLTETKELLGLLNPPDNVTGFKINNVGSTANLSWNANTDLDLSHYVVKYTASLSSPQWGAGVVLIDRVPKEATSVTVPTLVGSYMIKAVDSSGKESLDATYISTNVRDIRQYNVVDTIAEEVSWGGAKDNVHVVGGNLKLIDTSLQGTYYFSNSLDLTDVFTVRIVANILASGEDQNNTIDKWETLASIPKISTADPSDWSVIVQVRTTDDDPSGTPTWSSWSDFQIGDYTARAFEFRALLNSINNNTTPNVAGLGVTMDVEDRTESSEDVLTDISGQSVVVFSKAFYSIPALGISGQDMTTGDYYVLSAKDESGFTINFYDNTNTGVQRTFDWIAKGYGARE